MKAGGRRRGGGKGGDSENLLRGLVESAMGFKRFRTFSRGLVESALRF